MATAEVAPPPKIESAQQLEPGIQALQARNPLLPQQENFVFLSNVDAKFLPLEVPNPRPARVLFAGLRDPKLRMVQAIPLDISVENSTVVACWSEISEFGTGETLSAALYDFAGGVRELYYRLFAPDVNLGADLRRVHEILGRYIQPRQ